MTVTDGIVVAGKNKFIMLDLFFEMLIIPGQEIISRPGNIRFL